jgi:putative ABC transport system substrate-binding protein
MAFQQERNNRFDLYGSQFSRQLQRNTGEIDAMSGAYIDWVRLPGSCGRSKLFFTAGLAQPKLWAFLLAPLVCFLPEARAAAAQKMITIGSLNTADQFLDAFEGFKDRMSKLGYREGQTVHYEYHNSKGDAERLRASAQELVQAKVSMIVTTSTTGTVAAAKATRGAGIPVVFLSAANPQLLIKDFSGSGSNLAGISSASLELTAKRFELLRELAPGAKKMAMPVDPQGVNYKMIVDENRQAVAKLGFLIEEVHVRSLEEIAPAVGAITRKNYDGVFSPADTLISAGIDWVVKQSIKEKLPTITALLVNVKRGCLATYASDYIALGKQGAVLADKILKGAKPAALPVELPDKIKFALNLKTAKAIGMKISKEMLLRADEVFE